MGSIDFGPKYALQLADNVPAAIDISVHVYPWEQTAEQVSALCVKQLFRMNLKDYYFPQLSWKTCISINGLLILFLPQGQYGVKP